MDLQTFLTIYGVIGLITSIFSLISRYSTSIISCLIFGLLWPIFWIGGIIILAVQK